MAVEGKIGSELENLETFWVYSQRNVASPEESPSLWGKDKQCASKVGKVPQRFTLTVPESIHCLDAAAWLSLSKVKWIGMTACKRAAAK